MKQYPSGFVPVNFKNIGKVFLIIGIICISLKIIDLIFKEFSIPNMVFYFGIASIVLAAYLLFFGGKE